MNKTVNDFRGEAINTLGIQQGDHQRLFLHLIQTKEDFKEFMDKFYNGNIFESLGSFRTYKRRNSSGEMTKLEFVSRMKTNKKLTLEMVVQEPVTKAHIDLMDNINIPYNELYEKIQDLATIPFLNILKDWDYEIQEESDDFLISL